MQFRGAVLLLNERAPLAQLDRASDYESEGREFESLRARHSSPCFVFFGLKSIANIGLDDICWRALAAGSADLTSEAMG